MILHDKETQEMRVANRLLALIQSAHYDGCRNINALVGTADSVLRTAFPKTTLRIVWEPGVGFKVLREIREGLENYERRISNK